MVDIPDVAETLYLGLESGCLYVYLKCLDRRVFGEHGFEIGHDRDVEVTEFGRKVFVRRRQWRCLVRLDRRERLSFARWLLGQRRHIRQVPWRHPRVPQFSFRRFSDRTSFGVYRVEFIWRHKWGTQKCVLPVDVLLERLEFMEGGS